MNKHIEITPHSADPYRACAYLRLSKEDGDKTESDSIANQRDLISHFLSDKSDIALLEEQIDDGYSGARFERPAFQKMLAEIEAGRINCVIVKDLSRFGRNFVEVGRYLDQIFPAYGVRFIAINDNFDSAKGRSSSDNILLPFLNLVNDAFCRDISIKVRSQLAIKRAKGDFIGSFPVYGYRKDPENHHRLLPDDFAAGVVQDIFQWKLSGMSQQQIAARLNAEGVLSPLEYKRYCGTAYRSGFQLNPKAKWTAVAVGRILQEECYTGTLVQGKCTTPNHKVKKTVKKPSEEWVRVENTHSPIITTETFSIVKCLLQQDTRVAPKQQAVSLFSGLLFCGNCGQNMVKNTVCKNGKCYRYYICCNNRTTKQCSSHRISEQEILDSALASFKEQLHLLPQTERQWDILPLQEQVAQRVNARLMDKHEEIRYYRSLKAALYESLTDGLLDKEEYIELSAIYDTKLREAEAVKTNLEAEMENLSQGSYQIANFKEWCKVSELDRRLTVTLIERILVYEDRRIEIQFRYHAPFEQAIEQEEGDRQHG